MFKFNLKNNKKSIKAIYSEQLDKKLILEAKQLALRTISSKN